MTGYVGPPFGGSSCLDDASHREDSPYLGVFFWTERREGGVLFSAALVQFRQLF
jgi:hypothetical protein